MNKKLLSLLLALALVLSLTACGGKKEEEKEPEKPQVEEPAEQPAEEEESTEEAQPEEPVEEPEAEQPVQPEQKPEKPEQKPESKPAEKPAENPTTPAEKPAQNPAEKPAESKSVDLKAFFESTIAANQDQWPSMMLAEGEILDAWFPGLSAVETKQCYPYTPMITGQASEFVLVEVVNSSDVETVKAILEERINYHTSGMNMVYPATESAWKNDSRLVVNGNCLMLVVHGSCDDVVNSFNALFA